MLRKSTALLDVAVSFGGVSIGDATARVGFSIEKESMTIDEAEEILCGKRLDGRLVALPAGDDVDQQLLPGADPGTKHELKGTFDVKGYRSTTKAISTGAVFLLTAIDIELLGHFAKRSGRLIVTDASEMPEPEKKEPVAAPVPKVGGPWRKTLIGELGFTSGDAQKLAEADVLTAGDLQDRMTDEGVWWARGIKGIGDAAKERIEEAFNAFVCENDEGD